MLISKLLRIAGHILPLHTLDLFTSLIGKNPKRALRFLQTTDSQMLEEISRRKAVEQAKRASEKVEGYKKFLKIKGFDEKEIKNFKDFQNLPLTSKENYIKTCKNFEEVFVDSDLSAARTVYESSGYTGKPFLWAHNSKEEEEGVKFSRIGLENNFSISNKNTLFVNGFALGSWVSGMKFAFIMNKIGPTINPGADYSEILKILNSLGKKFPQIIIGGYPPFIKNLLEKGIAEGIDFKKYDINFLLAGEGFSESFRDYLYTLVESSPESRKSKIYSVYGTADTGVAGINENDDTIRIRRLSEKNSKLKKKLFNIQTVGETPMLFQYNPLSFFIEENKGEIIITTLSPDKIQPVIRYNVHDSGGVLSYKTMQRILKNEGIDAEIKLKLPFLYINGRTGGVISINSAKVYPETISRALYRNKLLAKLITGRFRLRKEYTKSQEVVFKVDIELKEKINPTGKLRKNFENILKKELCETNLEYNDMITHYSKNALPNINLIRYNDFKDLNAIKGIKHRYT